MNLTVHDSEGVVEVRVRLVSAASLVLRYGAPAARERARKLSASVPSVASSYNLWGLSSSLAQSEIGRRRLRRADAVIV